MESTKHTPGPWTIHEQDGTYYVNQERPLSRVATVVPGRGAKEDAALIAAAPDLLAMLKKVATIASGRLASGQDAEWMAGELQDELSAIRAAIARAEGK